MNPIFILPMMALIPLLVALVLPFTRRALLGKNPVSGEVWELDDGSGSRVLVKEVSPGFMRSKITYHFLLNPHSILVSPYQKENTRTLPHFKLIYKASK